MHGNSNSRATAKPKRHTPAPRLAGEEIITVNASHLNHAKRRLVVSPCGGEPDEIICIDRTRKFACTILRDGKPHLRGSARSSQVCAVPRASRLARSAAGEVNR